MWFWVVIFWETRKVLGLIGDKGSEQECLSPPSQNWNPVNKNLFPPTQIFGSCGYRVTSCQTPCCIVAVWPEFQGLCIQVPVSEEILDYSFNQSSFISLKKKRVMHVMFFFFSIFKNILFVFRVGKGGRRRGRETSMWGCLLGRAPRTGDLACNSGTCPDWKSNQ